MRLVGGAVYRLRIPFVGAFRHSAQVRQACDSVVVRVVSDTGLVGYGEGAGRPYVTGETPAFMVEHIARDLWPELRGRELPDTDNGLATISDVVPEQRLAGVVAAHAARCAVELAVLDCVLRDRGASVASVLPPHRDSVSYGGVITGGSIEDAATRAEQMAQIGLQDVKLKVGDGDDVARVRAVREALGPLVSLRLDANAAWDLPSAIEILESVTPYDIAAVEQPLPRDADGDLKALRKATGIPVMVDESLVTVEDAERLLADQAVDLINLRISKCGGLSRSLRIATMAAEAGVGVQLGCQVGETAILSAAGRHLAMALPDVRFIEGSYGTLLLVEDVATESVRFGRKGRAGPLAGPGLGIEVVDDVLQRYAEDVVYLSAAAG